MYFLNPLERKFDGEAQAWAGNGEKAPNCWGIGRWGHMEDFLPIPWLPIHPYRRGGRLWQGQDGGVRTQPCHTNPGLSKWPSYLRVGPDPSSDERRDLKRSGIIVGAIFFALYLHSICFGKLSDDEYMQCSNVSIRSNISG